MNKVWGGKVGLSGAGLAALLIAGPALAKIKPSVETQVRLGYDSNPFLQSGNDLASGYAGVTVTPKLSAATGKGEVSLTGHYDRTEYFKTYDGTDQYGAELEARQALSQKLTVFGGLRYDHSVIGQDDDVVSGAAPIDDTDINLIGSRARINTYSGSAGFAWQATPKDTVTVDGGYTASRYEDRPAGSNNDNYGGRIGYQRAISAKTKVGISGSAYRIDYDTPGLHSMVIQPNVTFSTQLSPRWQFDGSIGVSFTTIDLPVGPNDKSTGIAGEANLCHKGSKNTFCLFASRSVSGSGFGGTTRRSQAGFNFDQRLSEKLSLNAGGSYARSASLSGLLPLREYVSGHVGLSNRFARNLTVGIQGQYRDVFGTGLPVKADYGAEINATLALPGPK